MRLSVRLFIVLMFVWTTQFLLVPCKAQSGGGQDQPVVCLAALLSGSGVPPTVAAEPTVSRLPLLLYWLFIAEDQGGTTASQTLSEADSLRTDHTALNTQERAQIIKNMERARRFGLFAPEVISKLHDGYPLVATRGHYAGQPLSVGILRACSPSPAPANPGSWAAVALVPATCVKSPESFVDTDAGTGIQRSYVREPLSIPARTFPERLHSPAGVRGLGRAAAEPARNLSSDVREIKLDERLDLRAWGIKDWDLKVRRHDVLQIEGALISRTKSVHRHLVAVQGTAGQPGSGAPGGDVDCYEVKPFTVPLTTGETLSGIPDKGHLLYRFPQATIYLLDQPLSLPADRVRLLVRPTQT